MIAALLIVVCSHVNIYQQTKERVLWITHSTVDFIIGTEGFRQTAYKDIRGLWTTGVGHLIRQKDAHLLHRELSEAEVIGILHRDLEKCSTALESALNSTPKRHQIDALMSLCHNIGPDNMVRSEVVKYLNDGNVHKVVAFLRQINAGDRECCLLPLLDDPVAFARAAPVSERAPVAVSVPVPVPVSPVSVPVSVPPLPESDAPSASRTSRSSSPPAAAARRHYLFYQLSRNGAQTRLR
jgi:GH24 family phage-related lysozyme (muramidase)